MNMFVAVTNTKRIIWKKTTILLTLLLLWMPTFVVADNDLMIVKRACCETLDSQADNSITRRAASEGALRQLVLLVSFSDCDFSQADPKAFYDKLFNENGYNLMDGPGSVADYFRDQSEGRLHLQFDIYGPIKVYSKVKSNSTGQNTGRATFHQAVSRMTTLYPDIDYSLYDWDGDKALEHVVIIYAGYTGNQAGLSGYIWPTTGGITPFKTTDGYTIAKYTASGELWINNTSCGIGTICHEYSHALGLPDIYPTSAEVSDFSIVDEWDLMDGGTATNRGWCPPNYSALERMLMGWHEPKVLTTDTVVTALKPIVEGGESFLIRHTDDEFYLLENRQQTGWDKGLPGRGLVICHVNYNEFRWLSNTVNNVQGRPNYHIVAADGMTYTEWYNRIIDSGLGNPYVDRTRRLNSLILSTAPYPWENETGNTVRALSDTSEPAAVMYNENAAGSRLLGKSITDITQHADGTISFTFHANSQTGMNDGRWMMADGIGKKNDGNCVAYDLYGRRVSPLTSHLSLLTSHLSPLTPHLSPLTPHLSPLKQGLYIVNGRKVVVK